MEVDKSPLPDLDAGQKPNKKKGLFDVFLQPDDQTPEKNRILFMCAALFLAAVAVITLIGFLQ